MFMNYLHACNIIHEHVRRNNYFLNMLVDDVDNKMLKLVRELTLGCLGLHVHLQRKHASEKRRKGARRADARERGREEERGRGREGEWKRGMDENKGVISEKEGESKR